MSGSMAEESQVRAFYGGKNFFITGGTGFVGLCLIEKILRSIPDAGKIYLLMRPKKGKDISERLHEFPKNPVFEKLLETESTDIFKKLVPIAGDVGEENLGLSAEDRQTLVDNVNIVIHSAATLDFEDNLRMTVKINLLGTRRVMELCKQAKNLKVMVQVSSAYVNSYLLEVHEKLYDAPEDVEKVISLVATLTDDALNEIEPKLLKDHPNTYTFTKHMAEHEVAKCSELFPCTIVRPTMIVGSWKEPVQGWTCSKVGPQGFLMGAAKGVVRRLPLAINNIADYIPVDVVVNQLLVAGWNAAREKSGLTIYHCSSSTQKPFAWSMLENSVNGMLHKFPLKSAVWYPHLKFMPTLLSFRISAIFVHFFPALLLDLMLKLTGGRPILLRLHRNVWNSLNRLEKFIFTEWLFHNPKTIELNSKMNKTDQRVFFIDISSIYVGKAICASAAEGGGDVLVDGGGERVVLGGDVVALSGAEAGGGDCAAGGAPGSGLSGGGGDRAVGGGDSGISNEGDTDTWEEYFRKLHVGVRRYLNKESDKTLASARNKHSVLLALHVIWQLLIIWLLWFLFACIFSLSMTHSAWIAPIIYILYTML